MSTIILIEDSDERINWLRRTFPQHTIKATKYLEVFDRFAAEPHELAIFDHDLGESDFGGYIDPGYSGLDAAKAYKGEAFCLVWSWNPEGARRISFELRSRGKIVHVAQFSANEDCARVIRYLLGAFSPLVI